MKFVATLTLVLAILLTPARAQNRDAVEQLAAFATGRGGVEPAQRVAPVYNVERDPAAYRAWKLSLIPVIATQALDSASSYGLRELNPLLAGADGRFGAKAVAIKGAATAAILGIEYLVVKRHPKAARVLSKVNWSISVVNSALAAHNFSVR